MTHSDIAAWEGFAIALAGASAVLAGFHSQAQPPNAHATISGNSSAQNASPCEATRSVMTMSAPASRSATVHRVAFARKNGSSVPATRYTRGRGLGITAGGR